MRGDSPLFHPCGWSPSMMDPLGSVWITVDCQLNAATKQDVFPLPRIDDSLDLLAGSQFPTLGSWILAGWHGP